MAVPRMGRMGFLGISVALLGGVACVYGGPRPPRQDPGAVRAAIERTLAQFSADMLRGDAAAVASAFAPDAEYFHVARAGFLVGRPAIEESFARLFKSVRFPEVVINTRSVEVDGDTAYETGINRITSQAGDAPPVTRTGRYLTVWRRQPDGSWRIRVDAVMTDPTP